MPHVWQTEFPVDEAKSIATSILNHSFSLALVREAWVVVEYGIGQMITDQPVVHVSAGPVISEHDAVSCLLTHAESLDGGLATFIPLPWGAIIKAIVYAIVAVL